MSIHYFPVSLESRKAYILKLYWRCSPKKQEWGSQGEAGKKEKQTLGGVIPSCHNPTAKCRWLLSHSGPPPEATWSCISAQHRPVCWFSLPPLVSQLRLPTGAGLITQLLLQPPERRASMGLAQLVHRCSHFSYHTAPCTEALGPQSWWWRQRQQPGLRDTRQLSYGWGCSAQEERQVAKAWLLNFLISKKTTKSLSKYSIKFKSLYPSSLCLLKAPSNAFIS